jgi:hypothetical protein
LASRFPENFRQSNDQSLEPESTIESETLETNAKALLSRQGSPLAITEPGQEPKSRSRPRRRKLMCPMHPEHKILSVSPKHYLYLTEAGQLVLRGMSRQKADEVMAAYRQVLPLSNEWLECFWCEACNSATWWHIQRQDKLEFTILPVSREIWENASGVIRVEGNPTVSQFSRRSARATGVTGMRQYRFI